MEKYAITISRQFASMGRSIAQELAEQLQMQRSNLSTLLNELVADGKMEKLPGRPVHYRPLMAGDTPRGETSCFKILDS